MLMLIATTSTARLIKQGREEKLKITKLFFQCLCACMHSHCMTDIVPACMRCLNHWKDLLCCPRYDITNYVIIQNPPQSTKICMQSRSKSLVLHAITTTPCLSAPCLISTIIQTSRSEHFHGISGVVKTNHAPEFSMQVCRF